MCLVTHTAATHDTGNVLTGTLQSLSQSQCVASVFHFVFVFVSKTEIHKVRSDKTSVISSQLVIIITSIL